VTDGFDPAVPFVPRGAVPPAERRALTEGAAAVTRDGLARFLLTGDGCVTCLQGLVSCDVETPGDGAHLFGALLTPKGAIVSPLWVLRVGEGIVVEVPDVAADAVRQVLARSLPPRLCRAEDVSAATSSGGLYGRRAVEVLTAAGGTAPVAPGHAARFVLADHEVWAARTAARGLDGIDLVVAGDAGPVLGMLRELGATTAGAALLEERRILGGYPRIGAEIDARTLPQEAGFDELGGVSYTKGCYIGQETVARLHFRGHANRRLVGLALGGAPPPLPPFELRDGERTLGRLTSAAWAAGAAQYLGLAVLRREVQPGATLLLPGGSPAVVHPLPWPDA
jgi:folate-binding protein YgfZ